MTAWSLRVPDWCRCSGPPAKPRTDPIVLLVVADWLEEYGDAPDQARAEFLRLWCDREATREPWTRWWQLRDAHADEWLGAIKRADPVPGQEGALVQATLDAGSIAEAERAARDDPEAWAWVASIHLRCEARHAGGPAGGQLPA
ncbi:MAG: hypothetical protein K2W96_01580 [Gemmataceae bacterium]|nr:hypothetical protein [Gemmataceae bacterium]